MNWAELHCEGFHDRSFLAGWLEARGWTNLWRPEKTPARIKNPMTQKFVGKGNFAFQFQESTFLEIKPAYGKVKAVENACRTLKNSPTETAPPTQVVVVCDLDEEDPDACLQRLRTRLSDSRPPSAQIQTAAIIWHADGDFGPGVPAKQTLERLVCGALSRAYKNRGQTVQEWLVATGGNPMPKSYSWSHMAGWYAKHGCDDFYRLVWREELVRQELQALLDDRWKKELTSLESGSSGR